MQNKYLHLHRNSKNENLYYDMEQALFLEANFEEPNPRFGLLMFSLGITTYFLGVIASAFLTSPLTRMAPLLLGLLGTFYLARMLKNKEEELIGKILEDGPTSKFKKAKADYPKKISGYLLNQFLYLLISTFISLFLIINYLWAGSSLGLVFGLAFSLLAFYSLIQLKRREKLDILELIKKEREASKIDGANKIKKTDNKEE